MLIDKGKVALELYAQKYEMRCRKCKHVVRVSGRQGYKTPCPICNGKLEYAGLIEVIS